MVSQVTKNYLRVRLNCSINGKLKESDADGGMTLMENLIVNVTTAMLVVSEYWTYTVVRVKDGVTLGAQLRKTLSQYLELEDQDITKKLWRVTSPIS